MSLDYYPPGMTYNDLVHVGEIVQKEVRCRRCGEWIPEEYMVDDQLCEDCAWKLYEEMKEKEEKYE